MKTKPNRKTSLSNTTTQKQGEAARFLSLLAPNRGEFVFQTFGDLKKNRELSRVLTGTLDDHAATLGSLNREGAGVFVTVNELLPNSRRMAENVTAVAAVFADVDQPCGLADLLTRCPIPPHIVVESSPRKYHLYWLIDPSNPLPLDAFKHIQRAIAQTLAADPTVCDLSRVMRLPGYVHCKDPQNPHPVRLVATHEDIPRYTGDAIKTTWGVQDATDGPETGRQQGEPQTGRQAAPEGLPEGYDRASDSYARSTFRECLVAVRKAPEGRRNDELNFNAHKCYSLALADRLDAEEVTRAMRNAAGDAGLPADEINTTLESARKGAKPLYEGLPEPTATTPLADWFYVDLHKLFCNLRTGESLSQRGFEMHFSQLQKGSAVKKWSEKYGASQVVNGYTYDPTTATTENLIVRDGARTLINTYRPESVPQAAETLTPEGTAYISRMMRHLRYLAAFEDDDVADILPAWLAHQAQHPGQLLRWAPLIWGPPGVGKSFLRVLLQSIIGRDNVGVVTPDDIRSRFRAAWVEGSAVVVCEELKISGRNRYEIEAELKPLITDDRLRVERKGIDSYQISNKTNYIATSNYGDALPLAAGDRRWFVIGTPGVDRLPLDGDETAAEYFTALFDGLDRYAAEVRRYLLDYKIPKMPKTAPATDAKACMIAGGESANRTDDVRDLLETGGDGYGPTVLRLESLLAAVNAGRMFDAGVDQMTLHGLLAVVRGLGYLSHPKCIRYGGKQIRVWTKPGHRRSPLDRARDEWRKKPDEEQRCVPMD